MTGYRQAQPYDMNLFDVNKGIADVQTNRLNDLQYTIGQEKYQRGNVAYDAQQKLLSGIKDPMQRLAWTVDPAKGAESLFRNPKDNHHTTEAGDWDYSTNPPTFRPTPGANQMRFMDGSTPGAAPPGGGGAALQNANPALNRPQPGQFPTGNPTKTIREAPAVFSQQITEHAARNGIDAGVFSRLVGQESDFDPKAVSGKGAKNLTQIMPNTAGDPGFGVRPMQDGSWEEAVRFGADYLGALQKHYTQMGKKPEEALNLALGAYNWGVGNVDRWLQPVEKGGGGGDLSKVPPETLGYIQNIIGPLHQQQQQAQGAPGAPGAVPGQPAPGQPQQQPGQPPAPGQPPGAPPQPGQPPQAPQQAPQVPPGAPGGEIYEASSDTTYLEPVQNNKGEMNSNFGWNPRGINPRTGTMGRYERFPSRAASTTVNIGDKTGTQEMVQARVKRYNTIVDDGMAASKLQGKLTLLQDRLKDVGVQGPGAENVYRLAQTLESVGIPRESIQEWLKMVNVDLGNPAAAQNVIKMTNDFVAASLKGMGSNPTDTDANIIMQTVAGINNLAEANEYIINNVLRPDLQSRIDLWGEVSVLESQGDTTLTGLNDILRRHSDKSAKAKPPPRPDGPAPGQPAEAPHPQARLSPNDHKWYIPGPPKPDGSPSWLVWTPEATPAPAQ